MPNPLQEWEAREKHATDSTEAFKVAGNVIAPSGMVMVYFGAKTMAALNALGHTKMLYEDCVCSRGVIRNDAVF